MIPLKLAEVICLVYLTIFVSAGKKPQICQTVLQKLNKLECPSQATDNCDHHGPSSCKEIYDNDHPTENKAYMLQFGYKKLPVYCYMVGDDLGECGGGGWTLVMKIDGAKVQCNRLLCE
ncbi:uncharacterized protein LOC110046784 [Orbicella faveolata]|uniref:uncharacterized protein LOC110046707 n=1 Tax=Orbicella faveolata TaxID=48498 RepID=UPI0009E42972|nr:uncharacterized protein LOC110046707 [Orbicella faveolata]XP_020608157.1 uncharacterized protein LOC110046784 [Orbicella faveolata]